MSSGTITVTNKSDKVVGVGTAFTTDLKAGDVMVMPVGTGSFTLVVKSIESSTGLTLMEPFRGPTLSGQPWSAVPYETMLRINAQLSTQTGVAIYGLNLDKQNWQAVFSESGDITITLPDLTTFTGPSWKKIADLLESLDPTQLQAIATQIHTDAQQVATDKTAAQTAASTATQAKTDAQTAQGAAETAAAGSASSNQSAAQHASDASGSATAAAASATAAANSAASIHPENLLQKANHLSEFSADADAAAARGNLSVFSKAEIADLLPGYLGQVEWQEMRSALQPGTIPRDGQEVDQTGIYADLYTKAAAGKLPTCTESEWQADPLKRGCYVLESSPGKMRLPDDNGVQPGSLKIPVKVGDGGDATKAGSMGASALPNVKGLIYGYSILGDTALNGSGNVDGNNTSPDNPLNIFRSTINNYGGTTSSAQYASGLDLDLSRGNKMYQDNVTEVRANRQYGCWTVRIAAKATNGGSIDALALATAIASGDADLLAKINATNARLGYALISPSDNPALGSRTTYENPFGNNTPVFCVAEFYQSNLNEWINSSSFYYASSGQWGIRAGYAEGKGIVLILGNTGLNIGGVANAGTFSTNTASANYTTVSPVRIHVWKITQ